MRLISISILYLVINRFCTKAERELSLEHSATINHAYHTLKEPSLRAKYLLSLFGKDVDTMPTQSHDYLMWVMEMQERIQEATEVPELEELLEDVESRAEVVGKNLTEAFRSSPPDIQAAIGLTGELNYLHRMEQEIRDKLPAR